MPKQYLHNFDKNSFNQRLIHWFEKHHRDLPWRKTSDPYKIWISEIMLQQTKVDTVIEYYNRFINQYPTVHDLAQAEQQEVLKMWEGLGYYSRARNLHDAAKQVVENYSGDMPKTAEQLGKLKGIGPYTQGAIASIAYQLPEPAVDGNVMRVMSRVLCIEENISEQKTKKTFEYIIREIIDEHNPSYFNQGLMEIGALVCTPTSPKCLQCPLRTECQAFKRGIQTSLPIKLKQKKQKKLAYYAFIIRNSDGYVAIEQRPDKGLLANMWQFPMIEKTSDLKNDKEIETLLRDMYGITAKMQQQHPNIEHVFSHIKWDLFVYEVSVDQNEQNIHFVPVESLNNYPISVSHLKIKDYIV